MYRLNIANAQEILINALNEGKDALMLSPLNKNSTTLYPVKEHISIVRNIKDDEKNKGMSILTLQFKNMTVDTKAYIDKSIQIGTLVSTIGFLTENSFGPTYYSKGGINVVMNYLNEIPTDDFIPNKIFRLGVVLELSEVTASTKTYNTSDENVKPLENVKDFYYVIEERETPQDDMAKIKAALDVMRNSKPSTEDYPDIPDDTDVSNVSIKKDVPMI